jgi:hypothetical protein
MSFSKLLKLAEDFEDEILEYDQHGNHPDSYYDTDPKDANKILESIATTAVKNLLSVEKEKSEDERSEHIRRTTDQLLKQLSGLYGLYFDPKPLDLARDVINNS